MQRFFEPVDIEIPEYRLGQYITICDKESFPEWKNADLVILGITKDIGINENEDSFYAPLEIRKSLYKLYPGNDWDIKIADVGNFISNDDFDFKHLEDIISTFIEEDKSIIFIGGTQDLTYPIIRSINKKNKFVNLSIIDSKIDFDINYDEHNKIDSHNFINKILSDDQLVLNNINLLGVQTYYNHPQLYKIIKQLYIDEFKLGEIKGKINEIEPEIRNSHFVSLDVSSIENSYMPAQNPSIPNGFNGIEICEIARHAGVSPQNKIFGLFEFNPYFDKNFTGTNQAAEIIWYYIEGKNITQGNISKFEKEKMIKFHISNELIRFTFYKNKNTEQWWVEILDMKLDKRIFPCSYNDYKLAVNNIISKRIKGIIEKNKI